MRALGHPAVTFVAIRVAFLFGTALTLVWVLPSTQAVLAFGAYDPVTDYIFGAFAQWDSDWYLGIADRGYTEESAAFFPLFPGLVYVVGAVIGSNLVAGVLVSLAAAAVVGACGVSHAPPPSAASASCRARRSSAFFNTLASTTGRRSPPRRRPGRGGCARRDCGR